MARTILQNLCLLYLRDFFERETDAAHPASAEKILSYLESRGIMMERKALYRNLEHLRTYGMDIRLVRNPAGYYLAERPFQLSELKLLVDSVQSSRFITERKTAGLIKRIEALASVHDGNALQRQLIVRRRVKNMNESVFFNVDELSAAINEDRSVRFRYTEYNLKKETQYRRGGAFYHVSPYALIWDHENYYLLGFDAEDSMMKHYRVDRISSIRKTEEPRKGREVFEEVDLSAYTTQVFGMYHGEEEYVRLLFANHLIGAVIDRFGKDIRVIREDEDHFSVLVRVTVSPQFYGWLFSFGDEATILEPKSVRDSYREHLKKTAAFLDNRIPGSDD